MMQITVTLDGLKPGLLLDPMTDETLESLRTGVRAQPNKNLTVEKMAEAKLIKRNGKLGLPAEYLYGAIIEAGRKVKNGKTQISTAESSLVPSFLWLEDDFLPFANKSPKWVADKRRGCLPKDGTAVCIVRPKFVEWQIKCSFQLDEKECDESTARKLIEEAGKKVGLGAFRPSCRGPFGRFKVSDWTAIKEEEVA